MGQGKYPLGWSVESGSVVLRRRAVVTRRLVSLAERPHPSLLAADSSQSRSGQLLDKAFDEGELIVIGTEQIRSKRIFIYFLTVFLY